MAMRTDALTSSLTTIACPSKLKVDEPLLRCEVAEQQQHDERCDVDWPADDCGTACDERTKIQPRLRHFADEQDAEGQSDGGFAPGVLEQDAASSAIRRH